MVLCEANGIGVGRSNPCFEVWLILHIEAYDKPDGRENVQKHFEKICVEYNKRKKKTPNCDELVISVIEAESRAETQLRRRSDEGMPFGPPSTTVGQLTQRIRSIA